MGTANSGPTMTGYILISVIAVGFLVVAAVKGWRTARLDRADIPLSRIVHGWAMTTVLLLAGAMIFGVLAVRMTRAAVWFSLVPVVLGAAGWILQIRETHQMRSDRKALGMPALRRRVHWGWAAALGCLLGVAIAIVVMYVLIASHPYSTDVLGSGGGLSTLGVVLFALMLGLPVVLGYVQYVRRRVRDRQIRDADLASTGLVAIEPYAPPAWIPSPAEAHWRAVRVAMDEPVEPAGARGVLLRCVGANLGFVALGVYIAVLPSHAGSVAVRILIGVGAWLFGAGFFASATMRGTRAAWESVRHRSAPPAQ